MTAATSLAASLFLFELLLTRIFSLLLWYHGAFLAVSVAFVGIGLGGMIAAAVRRSGVPARAAAGYALGIPIVVLALGQSGIGTLAEDRPLAAAVACSALLVVPFFLFGFVIASLYGEAAGGGPRLYAGEIGGGVVACLAYPLLIRLGPGGVALVAAALAALGVGLLGLAAGRRLLSATAFGCAFLLQTSAAVEPVRAGIRVPVIVRRHEPDTTRVLAERWNAFSRVAAYPVRGNDEALFFLLDSFCGALLPRFPEGPSPPPDPNDLFTLPLLGGNRNSILVLGAGAGLDMLRARRAGYERIVGVEVNPDLVEMARDDFPSYGLARFLRGPGLSLHAEDGRTFVARNDQRYDVILIPWIQSRSAIAGGALALTENHLFTVEAFENYLARLEPGGFLAIHVNVPPSGRGAWMLDRLLATVREATGWTSFDRRVAVLTNPVRGWSPGVLLVKPEGATEDEIHRLRGACRAAGFHLQLGNDRMMQTEGVRTTRDDRPFFFFRNFDPFWHRLWRWGPPAFLMLLVGFPLFREGGRRGGRRFTGLFFVCIGGAFLAAESAWIQRSTLLLGNPANAIGTVLASVLAGTALGSMLSARFDRAGLSLDRTAWIGACGILVSVAVFRWGTSAMLTWEGPSRLVVVAAGLLAASVPLGSLFPRGLERTRRQGGDVAVVRAWGVNALAAMAGGLASVGWALDVGIDAVLAGAAGLYVLAGLAARPAFAATP